MRSFSRAGLGAVTATSMATSTFPIIIASVLAAQLIDAFGISRAQVGFLVTGSALVGSLASPLFGRITDRVGGVGSVRGTLAGGGVALAVYALSPTYWLLVGAAFLSGFPNAWGNPATNALIVEEVPPGERGLITGVKQSGVQFGTFLGGMLLPILTAWWSWRAAVLAFLVMPAGGLVALVGHRSAHHGTRPRRTGQGALPPTVAWIAWYGFLSALATSAIIGFVPLFANEEMGWSETAAGTLIALLGVAGIGARLLWPRLAERKLGHGRTLVILAIISTCTAITLALAGEGALAAWVLVPAVFLLGIGSVAWNAVGMLAVMDLSPKGLVGRGTGRVLLGFLLGLAIGPPLMGYSVDQLGTYTPGWVATGVLLMASGVLALKIPSGTTTS
ncbi:MAG: MFS transporter [Acidimicrobiia bacterium]|jgi:MFS family permease